MDQLDEILLGHVIHSASLQSRIDKGIGSDRGDRARLAGGDVADTVADDPLGEAVGFAIIFLVQCPEGGRLPPVSAKPAFDPPLVAKLIDPSSFSLPLTTA